VREVELMPELVALLKQHKAHAFARGHARPEDFVVSTAEGRPLYYRNVSRDLGVAADRAGLNDREDVPRLSTHDLRHTTISRWIRRRPRHSDRRAHGGPPQRRNPEDLRGRL